MTRLFTKRLFIAFTYAILLGLWSCADQLEELAVDSPSEPSYQTKSLNDAVYHERTKSWIVPQKDPYTLANFQKAYANLTSNRSVQTLSRAQTAEFTNQQPLEATHYSLKIFPRNEKEQWKIERMEDVKVAYTPFDYVPLPEADAPTTRSATNTYPDESRFTVTYDDVETTDGPAETVTYTMPVLYTVWPCAKPLPEDMVYEIDYEVFIPNYTGKARNSTLSTNAMQVLEAEAISLALGTVAPIGPTTRGPVGPSGMNGNIYCYDSFLKKQVPQVNLKQRFQLGSNIWDIYTNSKGYFSVPGEVPYDATYSHLFQHEYWKITWENSTTPFMTTWGTVREYWGSTSTTKSMCPTGGLGSYEMHPAVNYYYHGSHAVSTWHYESGIRIEAIPAASVDNYLGAFYSSGSSNAYIKIFQTTQRQNNHLAGTILHELGHFTHYGERGGYSGFHAVHNLIQESFASYHGWYITRHYYTGLGYTPSAGDIFTNQDRQDWGKTNSSKAYYAPLFVDLQDNYNQHNSNSSYNDDIIQGVPYYIIKEVAANCPDWNSVKTKLREKAGPFYSLTEINNFFAPYDYWFANN